MGLGGFFKKVGKGIGKVGSIVAPFTGPLAPLVGGATGFVGGLAEGKGLKGALLQGGLNAATSFIPGGGGAAGGIGANLGKVGLKSLATGVAKGAATNFATGAGTALATGQGVGGALKAGAQTAGSNLGTTGTGGFQQAAKTVGKQVAQNVGGHYAGQALQRAGVPGGLAQQGGSVFSNYLGNQFTRPGASPQQAMGQPTAPSAAGGFQPMSLSSWQNQGYGAGVPGGVPSSGGYGSGQGPTTTPIPQQAPRQVPIPGITAPPGVSRPQGPAAGPNTQPLSQNAPRTPQIPGITASPGVTASQEANRRISTTAPGTAGSGAVGGPQNSTFWGKYGPTIMQGAGVAAGIYAGKKATASAAKRSPEEQFGIRGEQGMARGLGTQGTSMLQESRPWVQQPASYYSSLLSGNRAAQAQAVAAPMAALSQQYRGAERGLERAGVRGAARDVAAAELGRDRTSKMAGLVTGVQPYAAEQLAGLGERQAALSAGMMGNAGQLYGDLTRQGYDNRVYSRKEGEKAGTAIGQVVADIGKVRFGGDGSGKDTRTYKAPQTPQPQMIPPKVTPTMTTPIPGAPPAGTPGPGPAPGGGPIQGPPGVNDAWWRRGTGGGYGTPGFAGDYQGGGGYSYGWR